MVSINNCIIWKTTELHASDLLICKSLAGCFSYFEEFSVFLSYLIILKIEEFQRMIILSQWENLNII